MWRQRNLGPYSPVALCLEDHLHLQQNECGVGMETLLNLKVLATHAGEVQVMKQLAHHL